jgi:dihydrofolate reductase
MDNGLVDEIRFMVHPIVLGEGKRLFHERKVFKLVDIKRFGSGVVVFIYGPGSQEGEGTAAS